MGQTLTVIKTLIVPAVISLIIFLLTTFVIIPVWRQYRTRYSQYLPLEAISDRTSSLRARLIGQIVRLASPSTWRRNREVVSAVGGSGDGIGGVLSRRGLSRDLDLEEGEELGDVDTEAQGILERHMRALRPEYGRRLSRELEEGFRDDSEEESD